MCAILIVLFMTLKEKAPEIGSRIGQWIAGCNESRAAEAFSQMYDTFIGGEGIGEVMEVLGEQLQNSKED